MKIETNLVIAFLLVGLVLFGINLFLFVKYPMTEELIKIPAEVIIRQSPEPKPKPLYQGPVPEGYDEDYFHRTGITKLLEAVQ